MLMTGYYLRGLMQMKLGSWIHSSYVLISFILIYGHRTLISASSLKSSCHRDTLTEEWMEHHIFITNFDDKI